MSANKHSVFVRSEDGKPLMPTTPSRARKLLVSGQAQKVWSKFHTFGIQMRVTTRHETQSCAMGMDVGTKFEGYSIVCDKENSLNVKLNLPNKKKIVAKLDEKRQLRRERRSRNCRRRAARFHNRRRKANWLAPSQRAVVLSRLKMIRELARLYPVTKAGLENVCFAHIKRRWGANFSTAEIGKNLVRAAFSALRITLHEYQGWETSAHRQRYGFGKGSDKSADRFESHCSDSLTLACVVQDDVPLEAGPFLVIDDSYRPVRRRLFDTQYGKGGVKPPYSRGTVRGIQKGRWIGTAKKQGMLVGRTGASLFVRCYTGSGRKTLKRPSFMTTQFNRKEKSC